MQSASRNRAAIATEGQCQRRAIVKTGDLPAPKMLPPPSGLVVDPQLPNCRQPSTTMIGPPRVLQNMSTECCAGRIRVMNGLSELRRRTAGRGGEAYSVREASKFCAS